MTNKRKPRNHQRTIRFESLESRNPLAVSSLSLLTAVEPQEAAYMRVRLETTTLEGEAVDSVSVDETFLLNLYVEDVSDEPEGVFTAFLDVSFDPELVEPLEIVYGSEYPNFHYGRIDPAGELRQIGGGAALQPLGSGEFLLASVPFLSRMEGPADFVAQTSVGSSLFEPLLFGESEPVDAAFISTRPAKVDVFEAVVITNDNVVPNGVGAHLNDESPLVGQSVVGQEDRHLSNSDRSLENQLELPEVLALAVEVDVANEANQLRREPIADESEDAPQFATPQQVSEELDHNAQLERRASQQRQQVVQDDDPLGDDVLLALDEIETLVLDLSLELPFEVVDDEFTVFDTVFAWLPLEFDSTDAPGEFDGKFTLTGDDAQLNESGRLNSVVAAWSIPSISDALLVVTVGAAIAYRDLKKERDKAEQEAVYIN